MVTLWYNCIGSSSFATAPVPASAVGPACLCGSDCRGWGWGVRTALVIAWDKLTSTLCSKYLIKSPLGHPLAVILCCMETYLPLLATETLLQRQQAHDSHTLCGGCVQLNSRFCIK